MSETTTAPAVTKRERKCLREYHNQDGSASKSITPTTTGFTLQIVGSDKKVTFDLSKVTPEVYQQGAIFGFATKITNNIGQSGMGVAEMVVELEDQIATLYSGEWNEGRSTGPRSNDLVEAMKRTWLEAGKQWTDELAATAIAKINDEETGKAYAKSRREHADVARHLAAIRIERLQAAMEKAGKAESADLEI